MTNGTNGHDRLDVVPLERGTHDEALAELWIAATDARREAFGMQRLSETGGPAHVLARPGAFGAGIFDGPTLLSAAAASPALEDNARSSRQIPGLMHISSVATLPDRWGKGLGRRVVQAILLHGKRRGYARTQLWTHASNPASRHLYESMGFALTGRTLVDDFGEDVVHYVRELDASPMPPRPAARILCCDDEDRVLLLHWRDPYDGFRLWEPPGGGLEPGESARDAVLREWAEETGLPAPELVGEPVVVGRDLYWLGDRYVGDEHFYLARTTRADAPDVSGQTEIEQAAYLGHAWVHWSEIADLDAPDEPDVLAVLRRLDPTGPWAATR